MINPEILIHYRKEESLSEETAAKKLNVSLTTFKNWEDGKKPPTYNQLINIASKYRVPVGYLTLDEPVEDPLPVDIKDFRTPTNKTPTKPSKNLLYSIYDAQHKQSWLREIRQDEEVPPVIGKDTIKRNYKEIAQEIRTVLNIDVIRKQNKTKDCFLRSIISRLDEKGFLIIKNGKLGYNTHRKLDEKEFKGFAIFDEMAPLIFINGKDFLSSQIFTIAHELAHLYLKESGIDGYSNLKDTEAQCNRIAAEVLLPEIGFQFEKGEEQNIANYYKISVFVVLIKARQLEKIDKNYFEEKWDYFKNKVNISKTKSGGGGNYNNSVRFVVGGNTFLDTVIRYTLGGKTLYRDAYRLTGMKGKTFETQCQIRGYL